ncbi:MAG TPA: branched-chain amino acid ABC transporter permease, partial [Candidatus Limiplasma sp.]|nr:branched-chain amino acid ABC transporter permease [Candidatus Limiplasma sp.]
MNNIKAFVYKYRIIAILLLLVVLCVLPFVVKKALYVRYACNILMFTTLAGSLNVINGYSGQFNLGQAGFFAIGAYTCAILSTKFAIDFWLLLPIAGLFAAFVGLIVALPTLKLNGIYLAVVTLGASEIIRVIAQTWQPVTGGSLGIKNIPYPWMFGLD